MGSQAKQHQKKKREKTPVVKESDRGGRPQAIVAGQEGTTTQERAKLPKKESLDERKRPRE